MLKHIALAAVVSTFVLACASSKPSSPEGPAPTATPAPASDGPSSQPAATSSSESSEAEHEKAEAVASQGRDAVDADGVVRRGSPLTASLTSTPVSVAVAKAKDLTGQKVKLAGKVGDVCAKAGCWFVVVGDKPEDRIRISTKAHNIFVPHNAVGMNAVVEGTLNTRTIDAKLAEHLAGDSKGPAPKAGDVEVTIDVTGLEMTKG